MNEAKDSMRTDEKEYAALLAIAKEKAAKNGHVVVSREALHADFLNAGWAPRLSGDLGLPWIRDDKNGTIVFGA